MTYSELLKFDSFEDRLNALILNDYEYNSPRSEIQTFFKTYQWKKLREKIIKRDLGYDLGIFGVSIHGKIIVHHIDPVTIDDIRKRAGKLTDPDNLITVSLNTHNIIHYGKPLEILEERKPGDTILW